ncbi:hypothetical protein CPB84DRAFT_1786187 [Gymnopilus junonius]|uniref:Uncharacterized protein n=1 Tax=Gymnopilus junonius TaxID=109634 RepID=A0A9P5NIF1_GYMJU|nr:hypothetical protein CPB84DRAFT_1786187 [Gymnopilus junonius]
MGEVKVYFKLVETGQYMPGGSEDLKVDIGSYYNIPNFDVGWLLKLNSDSGVVLDNSKAVKNYKVKDNNVLFIQDPNLFKIQCLDNGAVKPILVKKSDTLETLKNRLKSTQAKDYDFILTIQTAQPQGSSTIESLYNNFYLNLAQQLYRGQFTDRAIDTNADASDATYVPFCCLVQVELDPNGGSNAPKIFISYLDNGIKRYLCYHSYTTDYIIVLTNRYSIEMYQQWNLTILNGKATISSSVNYDWSFVA